MTNRLPVFSDKHKICIICEGNEEYAYLAPAKAMALTVVDLLFDNAEKGKEILKNFTPIMTKEEYLKFMDSNDKVIKA